MTKLVIVESKAKAKRIAGFLGSDWKVEASMGYMRDLPEAALGIDIVHGFQPEYRVLPQKAAVVRRLTKAMNEAEVVYLATDPDVAGELMAWHILELAKLPPTIPVYRITFTSITKSAVLNAVNAPRALNDNLVDAQQARREIERLVGYLVSAPATRLLGDKQSVGWLSGICLRQTVQREIEIKAFTAGKYWTLDALFETTAGAVK